jgi:hypothetical protein
MHGNMTDNIQRGTSDARCMDDEELLIQRACRSRTSHKSKPGSMDSPSFRSLTLSRSLEFYCCQSTTTQRPESRAALFLQTIESQNLQRLPIIPSRDRQTHIGAILRRSWCSCTPDPDDCLSFQRLLSTTCGPLLPLS